MLRNLRTLLAYYIGDIVYGANDGIITTFAVISGAAGAGFSPLIIIVLGIANLIADGFSMGASKYLSLRSEQSLEVARGETRSPLGDGLVTFISFVIIGTLPLIPFLVARDGENIFHRYRDNAFPRRFRAFTRYKEKSACRGIGNACGRRRCGDYRVRPRLIRSGAYRLVLNKHLGTSVAFASFRANEFVEILVSVIHGKFLPGLDIACCMNKNAAVLHVAFAVRRA